MADTNKILGAVINERFRVKELIGRGGSGQVYLAVDVDTDAPVALKILKDVSVDDDESVIRFEKEVAVSAKLTNPHTVRVYEFGKTREGYLVIAMEYLQGAPLTSLVKSSAPLSPKRTVHIVRQTLEALAEAHTMGIVHRDLKPDNIFILEGEHSGTTDFIKVLDFGIAKFLHDDSVGDTLTRDGFVFGTPLYISPEQALGWQVTPASDIYSLGVVLFEMLTGETPFTAETPIGLGMKHIYEPPPLDRLKVEEGSVSTLKRLLALMLEKRPERRPANAAAALALFENLEEVSDQPFDIARAQVIQHDHSDDSPTVRSKPTTDKDVEEFIDEQVALAEAEIKSLPAEADQEPEQQAEEANEAEEAGETQDYTQTAAAVVAEEEAAPDQPEKEPEPAPKPQPEKEAEEMAPKDPPKNKKRRKKRRKKGKAEAATTVTEAQKTATPTPESKPLAEPEPEPAPAEALVAPLVDPHPVAELAERAADRRQGDRPEPKRPAPQPMAKPATAEDFSLFGGPTGFSPPVDNDLPSDDWRLPSKRRTGGKVPVAAWIVLLLGLLVAAFVLYAVTRPSKSAYSPESIIPISTVELPLSPDDTDSC